MRTVIVTKMLDQNHIELRDYQLFKEPIKVIHCRDENYKVHVHIEDPYMFLSLTQQKKGVITNTQQSQYYPYSYYKMYKYLWKPYKAPIQDNISVDYSAIAKLELPDNWEETRRKVHGNR